MTEPARVVQKLLVDLLEDINNRAVDSSETTRPEVIALWYGLKRTRSEGFLESLKQDPEIANLRFAADVEIERRRADELAMRADELSRSITELAQRVQVITNEKE